MSASPWNGLALIGIIGAELGKPLNTTVLWRSRGVRWALKLYLMILRDASLSNRCTPDHVHSPGWLGQNIAADKVLIKYCPCKTNMIKLIDLYYSPKTDQIYITIFTSLYMVSWFRCYLIYNTWKSFKLLQCAVVNL